MKLPFPKNFLWGTATSALQIETVFDHDWKGFRARDGYVYERGIEHDLHRHEDADIISSIGNTYRFSFDWSKLQREPYGQLETRVVEEYRNFLGYLKDKKMHIMLVLHHFANPNWFVKTGSWIEEHSIALFKDYVKKVAKEFGDLVDLWNTFNEPLGYATNSYLFGNFPYFPLHLKSFRTTKRFRIAKQVLNNLSKAHVEAYITIKDQLPDTQVGISNFTQIYEHESILGFFMAKYAEKWLCKKSPKRFDMVDFIGISYYGRIPFRPHPITEVDHPGLLDKLKKPHDKMVEYYPQGLKRMLLRFYERYQKPIYVTETGCCTDDDAFRIIYIRDHLKTAHEAIEKGVDLRGIIIWSIFDNPELHLGIKYPFGLVHVDYDTMERKLKPSAYYYAEIAKQNYLEI